MGLVISEKLITSSKYTVSPNGRKYIVIHYTGNDCDTAIANRNYFNSSKVKASAHYVVDDKWAIRCVPDNYIAWHCGGSLYNDIGKTGGGKYYNKCKNTNSIGIEMCDTKKDGKHKVSEKTRANTIELVKYLMKRYKIPVENVIRHFDVTGKYCPEYYCLSEENDLAWKKFKEELSDKKEETVDKEEVNNTEKENTESIVKEDSIKVPFTVKVKEGTKLYSEYSSKVEKSTIEAGVYTIVEVKGKRGKLKSGIGWIDV